MRHLPVHLLALAALGVLAPGAAANVPAPVTKTNTVRVPALGNLADGTLTTKVSYTQTTATAAASTANTIGLGKGFNFRLRTRLSHKPLANPMQRFVMGRPMFSAAAFVR